MGGLFLVLAVLVGRADRLIRRQHAALRIQSEGLERRVAERTRDLAETQVRAVESAKMASLGTMAAGVAHEINNPLGSVATCAEGLLDLARDRPGRTEAVDLAEIAREVLVLLGHRPEVRDGRVRILGEGFAPARGDPDEIQQVFLNLLQKALDAIEGRPDGRVDAAVREDGARVVHAVRDNGSGFRPEDRPRLFDPFFTTKEPGRGTGLGLALCRRIVERHGGEIRAEPAGPGRGAIFEVLFPRGEAAA